MHLENLMMMHLFYCLYTCHECYSMYICIPSSPYIEILSSRVMVLRWRTFETSWDWCAFNKLRTLLLASCEDTTKWLHLWTKIRPLPDTKSTLGVGLPTLRIVSNKFLLFISHILMAFVTTDQIDYDHGKPDAPPLIKVHITMNQGS